MASDKILPFLLFCVCLNRAKSRMDGAPDAACNDMTPQHGPATSDATLTQSYKVSMDYDTTSKKFEVTLEPVMQDKFKGFFLRIAEEGSPPTKYVEGTFEVPANQAANVKLVTCDNGPNAVTHVNNRDKDQIKATWMPDAKRAKDNIHIVALATVVKEKEKFLVGLKSAPKSLANPAPAPKPPSSPAPSPPPPRPAPAPAPPSTAPTHNGDGRHNPIRYVVIVLVCSMWAIF